jgi:GTPase SAR1 family protein
VPYVIFICIVEFKACFVVDHTLGVVLFARVHRVSTGCMHLFVHRVVVSGEDCAQIINICAGQREFVNMLPLVCNDAVAILFMFDLSRKSTLNSVKEWYRQARGFNKVCIMFIIYSRTSLIL